MSTTEATTTATRAVFWDFGGVILSSPFEAFNRYEAEQGLPTDFIRSVNTRNPDTNAWALIERREIDATTFDGLFAAESEALGHRVPGRDVLAMLSGAIRPEMVTALDRVIEAGYVTACLTNNIASGNIASGNIASGNIASGNVRSSGDGAARPDVDAVMQRFDHVVESSSVGHRKPEPRFYEIACELAGVTPVECVFLDDLGINLKPAKAMGMTTIKVLDAEQAITDLEATLGIPLR